MVTCGSFVGAAPDPAEGSVVGAGAAALALSGVELRPITTPPMKRSTATAATAATTPTRRIRTFCIRSF